MQSETMNSQAWQNQQLATLSMPAIGQLMLGTETSAQR
jgi:hypothetical protein